MAHECKYLPLIHSDITNSSPYYFQGNNFSSSSFDITTRNFFSPLVCMFLFVKWAYFNLNCGQMSACALFGWCANESAWKLKSFNFYSKWDFFSVHNFRSFIQIITRYCVAFNWKRDRDAEQINTFHSLMVTTETTMAAVTLIEGKVCKPSEWWWILRFSSSTAYNLDNQSRVNN